MPARAASSSDAPPAWGVALAAVALAFLVYHPALGNGFYNDDALFLNEARAALAVPSHVWTSHALGYFRPVWAVWVTALYAVCGLHPAGYFAAGILLHAANGFLVWLLARRFLPGAAGPLIAMATFLTLFAHCEAVLWISAHNSALAAGLCLLAAVLHLRAVETGRAAAAAATAFVVLLALLCKETAVTVLAWIPIVEVGRHGWRRIFTRDSILRLAAIGAVALAYVLLNPRLAAALQGGGETRAAVAFLRPERILGAFAWLASPVQHFHRDLHGLAGVGLLILAPLAAAVLRREAGRAAIVAVGLALAGLLPASTTVLQNPNGSRLYYLPTAGMALLAGALAGALGGARRTSPAWKAARLAGGAALAGFLLIHVLAIRTIETKGYRPISRAQTRLAQDIGRYLPPGGSRPVYLLEPPIDNVMHLAEFLYLFQGLPRDHVSRFQVARGRYRDWLRERRRIEGVSLRVLDWRPGPGLVPATSMPLPREAAVVPRRVPPPGRRAAYLRRHPLLVMRVAR